LRWLTSEELREFEPHAQGVAALHVSSTGITNYSSVCEKYVELMQGQGGTLRTNAAVSGIRSTNGEFAVETSAGTFGAKYLINCAGLFSDRVSRMAGVVPDVRIVPFRGEYYDLVPERASLVRWLIYPVPDPRFPFLGVHFTRRVQGTVDAGPNAILALKREGYRSGDFSVRDAWSSFSFPGFWKLAAKYWKSGVDEGVRSVSKAAFVKALQKLVPDIRDQDLVPGGSGVRAQAITKDGALVDDFQFSPGKNMLHVYNVPSPAATASLAVGRTLVGMATKEFGWG
jgi:L-2-hydroxyglutarate oxidase LhgO